MEIPKELYKNATIHRNLTADSVNGILSCGFLVKPTDKFSDRMITFSHYGAFLLLSGSGVYFDEDGRKIDLKAGCFVQRIPGKSHTTQVTPDGKWLEFFVCFGKDLYEYLAQQKLLSREPVLFNTITESLLNRCVSLLDEFKTTPDSRMFTLFLSAQEFAMALTKTSQNEQFRAWGGQMAKACDLLCTIENFSYMSPVQVAEKIDMEYETFRKRFKDVFNCSPSVYQMQYRLNYSKQLLLETNKTIQQIATDCCFADSFTYSKAFKKYYGFSPTQFRKRYI